MCISDFQGRGKKKTLELLARRVLAAFHSSFLCNLSLLAPKINLQFMHSLYTEVEMITIYR